MQIGTAIFKRIHQEAYEKGARDTEEAALRAIVTTMGETARFGTFTPDVLLAIAKDRLTSWLKGKGW